MLAAISDALRRVLDGPFDPGSRLYWGWLVGFFVVALGVGAAGEGVGTTLRALFSRETWLHRSTRLDFKLTLARLALAPQRLGAWIGVAAVAHWTALGLDLALGPRAAPDWTSLHALGLAVGLLLANDFAMYVNHRLSHRIPTLWTFHSLHHSAEVLTPLTTMRAHPVYDLTRLVIRGAVAGPLMGGVAWVFTGEAEPLQLLGVNALWAVFLGTTANLRHSPVPLRFGPVLGRVFSSPGQHHIHHSRDPAHHDRNFGTVFAIWDVLLGTHHLPDGHEVLSYGLDRRPPTTLFDAWIAPFGEAGRALFPGLRR